MILDLDQPEYSVLIIQSSPESTLRAPTPEPCHCFAIIFLSLPFTIFPFIDSIFTQLLEKLFLAHICDSFARFEQSTKVAQITLSIFFAWTAECFACQRKFSVTKRGLLEARGLFFWRASANLGIPQIVSHHPAFLFSSPQTHFRPFCHLELLNFFTLCDWF